MAVLARGAGRKVTAQMDADYSAGLTGANKFVLPIGKKMSAEIIDNNTVRINDGVAIIQGRYIYIEANTYKDFPIENGTQGTSRYDVIGYRLYRSDGEEFCEKYVKKGAEEADTLDTGVFRDGDQEMYIPLYKVNIEELSITSVEPLFETIQSIEEIIKTVSSNYKRVTSNCRILENRINEQILTYDNMLSDSGTEYTEIRNQKTVFNRRTGEVNIYARLYLTKDVPAGKNFKVATVSAAIGQVAFALPVTITTAITSTSQAKAGYFPVGSEYPLEIRVTSLTTMKSDSYAYIHLQYFPDKTMLTLQDDLIVW